ncbi:MAG: translation initiation factor Sui1 [Candidatus Velthaea sp.]
MPDDRRLVYSTDGSLPLPAAQKRKPSKACGPANALPSDGVIRVLRERRRASIVTIVHGLDETEIAAAGKELRRMCGTGGTTKAGVVELQGDHRDAVVAYFEQRERRVKRAGG